MEVLINELSLKGQFENENNFFDSFDCVLGIFKVLDDIKFTLSKEHILFEAYITNKLKLQDLLKLRSDRARKMKRFLAKLTQSPSSWNDNKKHNCTKNTYVYSSNDICNTSLAESCERDKIIVSFEHSDFIDGHLKVQKNNNQIDIFNIIDRSNFLDYVFGLGKIILDKYYNLRFKNTNLDFTLLDNKNGFNLLNKEQTKEYIQSFIKFSSMKWVDIDRDGGFQYKPYKGDIFKKTIYSSQDIKKFRVSQLYRCFGYRKKDVFYVLRFEIDHKISDKG